MVNNCPSRLALPRQQTSGKPVLGKHGTAMRQCALVVLSAAILAGCSKSDGIQSPAAPGQVDYLKGFVGGVAADEPRAALVARDILSAGGSAADAAAAAALAYAVTYPSGGGLGSGGVCVVGDAAKKRAETIEFPAIPAKAGGPIAMPALVRGLGLLQGRHGKLRWEAVVAPAEQLARFGEGTSRAFMRAATETRPAVIGDPALAPIFAARTGMPVEGERRSQPQLASVLARLRSGGPGEFYQGALGHQIAADIAAAGGSITLHELRGYAAGTGKPIEVPFAHSMKVYASSNASGGAIAAWLIEQSFEDGLLIGSGKFRTDKFAASLGQAYRGLEGAPVYGFGSSSVAVMDRTGQSVACTFAMGPAFGSRRVGRESGILFAAAPGAAGDETPYMTALVGINTKVGQGFIAAASAGGAPAAAAVAQSVLEAALGKTDKDRAAAALAKPRLLQFGAQSPLLHEPGADPALLGAVRSRGGSATETGRLGRVNLGYCSEGLPRGPASCSFAADRRGYGLATGLQF